MLREPVAVITEFFRRLRELDRFCHRLRGRVAADDGRLVEDAELQIGKPRLGSAKASHRDHREGTNQNQIIDSRFSLFSVSSVAKICLSDLAFGAADELAQHRVPREREVGPIIAAAAKAHDTTTRELIGEPA